MFELGFLEIVLIVIVAFVVVGPEKLPKVLAKIYKWVKKASSYIFEFKNKIDRELEISELREEANKYKNDLLSAHQKLNEMAQKDVLAPFKNEANNLSKLENETKTQVNITNSQVQFSPNFNSGSAVTLKKDSAKSELQELFNKKNINDEVKK